MNRTTVAILCIGLLATLVSGCGEDEKPSVWIPPHVPIEYAFPDTPDQLMQNFEKAYGLMDIVQFREILHPSFIFKFLATDLDHIEVPGGDRWFCANELTSTTRMFNGSPGFDGENTVPGISDITFELFDQDGVWGETDDPVDFPDAERAVFNAQVSFLRAGNTTIQVKGQALFYVTSKDSTHDGEPAPYYQLRGWVDGSRLDKPNRPATWGGVKFLFQED